MNGYKIVIKKVVNSEDVADVVMFIDKEDVGSLSKDETIIKRAIDIAEDYYIKDKPHD